MLKHAFSILIVRPLVLFIIGLNIRHKARLPETGPAIVVANHNSHLDTLVLMTLFPLSALGRVRPVAAADYFMRNKVMAWFATKVMGIIPIERSTPSSPHNDPLEACQAALEAGEILIVFPEGTRGPPEEMKQFKCGVAHLAKRCPHAAVTPVFLHGLGKILPKGAWKLVPLFCDVFVGKPLFWQDSKKQFMSDLSEGFETLSQEDPLPAWE